jgi:hypothetical protein
MTNQRAKYSRASGKAAEKRFVRSARNKGLFVTKSSHTDDIHNHIDYWIAVKDGKKWGVDVKGNNLPDEIWCEFKNVNGNEGWMYGGASIIAFDMPEVGGFCIVSREELAFFCERYTKNEMVENKDDAYLKKYSRKDRDDVITKIKLSDLESLVSYRVWEYDKKY